MPVVELFNRAGLAASNGEARRLIRGGGARLNDAVVKDETRIVRLDDRGPDGALKLSAGASATFWSGPYRLILSSVREWKPLARIGSGVHALIGQSVGGRVEPGHGDVPVI